MTARSDSLDSWPSLPSLAATQAHYLTDSTRLTCESTVLSVTGARVALDGTVFYPEGGGQAADTGWLSWEGGRAAVVDVRKDKATGVIWHSCTGDVPPPGVQVTAQVDAGVRWRHMQRHSGEHLLAQAFRQVNPAFQVAAVSMSCAECTLDLLGSPTERDVRAAEQRLREVLGRDSLRLDALSVPEEQLAEYPLRRESKVRGVVRLVTFRFPDGSFFDVSACGGTHVPLASLCAPVVILRTERIKAELTRVVFMAGEEASAYLAQVYRDAKALAQGFSVPVERLTVRVQALVQERQTLAEVVAGLHAQLAEQLLRGASTELLGGVPVRFVTVPDSQMSLVTLGQVPAGGCLVVTAPDGRCGISSGRREVHAGELLRSALEASGGKGGGKADLAQGRTDAPDAFQAAVRQLLTET